MMIWKKALVIGAVFSVMLASGCKAIGGEQVTAAGSTQAKVDFVDISDHWARASIISAVAKGYVDGYPDKSFRNPTISTPSTITGTFEYSGKDFTGPFDVRIREGTTIYATRTFDGSSLVAGQPYTITATVNWTSSGPHLLYLDVDYNDQIIEGNENNNSTPLTVNVQKELPSGDFTVNPPSIMYRDSFTLIPKPFTIPPGCKYQYHQYMFNSGGLDLCQ